MIVQAIAELGGYGAIGNLMSGVFSQAFNGWREALLLTNTAARDNREAENKNNFDKFRQIIDSTFGKGVVWTIIGVSLAVLSAGVWVPLLGLVMHFVYTACGYTDIPTIAVTWYFPKEGSFLFFEWDSLKEYTVGQKNATYTIAILPSFISMAANAVSFFMVNRVRKKLY